MNLMKHVGATDFHSLQESQDDQDIQSQIYLKKLI